jgi:hypothetical protein
MNFFLNNFNRLAEKYENDFAGLWLKMTPGGEAFHMFSTG